MTDSTTPRRPAAAGLVEAALYEEKRGALAQALQIYRSLARAEPQEARWPLECARLLSRLNRGREANTLLAEVRRRFPGAMREEKLRELVQGPEPTEENLRKALKENCPSDAQLKRAPMVDDGSSDVIVARGGRPAAALVFTGLADRIVMPLPLFDRYLAELDLSAVYLRDRRRLAYFGGVGSLGADYASTLEALRELLGELGAATVHTIGNSAGGFGAISYGLDLGAAHVLGFASPIVIHEKVGEWDARAPVFVRRVCESIPPERRDIPARLAANRMSQIHLVFGADSPDDSRHAEAVKDCPNVELIPIEGLAGHGALFALANAGRLRPRLKALFGPA